MAAYKVGQTIKHPDGKQGVIRFVGNLVGKPGTFIGVELNEPLGKNDGSVEGKYYFKTKTNHGIFYRDSSPLQVIAEPKVERSAVTARPARPVSTTSLTNVKTRQSMGPATSKRVSIAGPSQASGSQSPTKRQSMAPPAVGGPTAAAASRAGRQSLAPRSLSPQKPAPRLSTIGGRTVTSPPIPVVRRPSAQEIVRTPLRRPSAGDPKSPPVATTSHSPRVASISERSTQDDARAKQLERARAENRDLAKELEQKKEMTQRYENITEKLQIKCKAQHEEVQRLQKVLKEKEQQCDQLEKIAAEHDSLVEMATLDREMAEEKEDAVRADLEAVRDQYEELKLEHDILKVENDELAKDMSPEERASQGWLQMEREKERLKQALIRLRELTQEREAELSDQVQVLEADNEELTIYKEQFEDTKVKLLETEANVEDLREQLEVAENAEQMIEQLTDRNANLSDRVDILRNEVEDLSSLKEVSDETEQQYSEYIKQLEELLDNKDSSINEVGRQALSLREDIEDKDYTIARFRDLVTNMQSDLEDMRASKEITETEALELGNHTRTMMDLNRQLQASATSTRLKAIDNELQKMETGEASEHLTIVQLFLPEAFHADRDSILALLRFRRIGLKSRLLHTFVKEHVTSPSPHSKAENVLVACDALDKLTWVATTCDRFTDCIRTSSSEEFSKFESTLYELEPVERTLNKYIDLLKKDQLEEQVMVDGLQRSIAVMSHLSDLHLRSSLESYAEEVLMKTQLMHSSLENTAAALAITKKEILRSLPTPSDEEDEEVDLFMHNVDTFITQTRGAKVIGGKILKSLQDFKTRKLALDPETQPLFSNCSEIAEGLALGLRTLGSSILDSIQEDGQPLEVDLHDILDVMRSFNSATFNVTGGDPWIPLVKQLRRLHERLSELYNISTDLSATAEFETPEPPWLLRSKELAATTHVSVEAEAQIAKLKREVAERTVAIKRRDLSLADATLKAETLEARMRDSTQKAARITELEQSLAATITTTTTLRTELDAARQRSDQLEEERNTIATEAQNLRSSTLPASNAHADGNNAIGTSSELARLTRQIDVLNSTTRFLRLQLRRTQTEELQSRTSWLSTPLVPDAEERKKVKTLRADMLAKLDSLARLPSSDAARPVVISPPTAKNIGWKPRKETVQYQMAETELEWLRTWGARDVSVGWGGDGVVIVS